MLHGRSRPGTTPVPEPSVAGERRLARSVASRQAASVNGSMSIESVVALVRSLWKDVEEAGERDRVQLERDIAQTINRLKNRVEKSLRASPSARAERLLFDDWDERPAPVIGEKGHPSRARF